MEHINNEWVFINNDELSEWLYDNVHPTIANNFHRVIKQNEELLEENDRLIEEEFSYDGEIECLEGEIRELEDIIERYRNNIEKLKDLKGDIHYDSGFEIGINKSIEIMEDMGF